MYIVRIFTKNGHFRRADEPVWNFPRSCDICVHYPFSYFPAFFFTGVHFRSRTIISGEFPETHVVVTRLVLQLSKLLFSWFLPSFVLSLFVLLTGVLASAAKR